MDTKLYPNAVRYCSLQIVLAITTHEHAFQGDPRWAALGIETVSHSPEVRRLVSASSLSTH